MDGDIWDDPRYEPNIKITPVIGMKWVLADMYMDYDVVTDNQCVSVRINKYITYEYSKTAGMVIEWPAIPKAFGSRIQINMSMVRSVRREVSEEIVFNQILNMVTEAQTGDDFEEKVVDICSHDKKAILYSRDTDEDIRKICGWKLKNKNTKLIIEHILKQEIAKLYVDKVAKFIFSERNRM